jgi:hypothetical protein
MSGLSLDLFEGNDISSLRRIDGVQGTTSKILQFAFQIEKGKKYIIAVKDNLPVHFAELVLTFGPVISNDDFANRSILSGTNIELELSLKVATKEPGEIGAFDGFAVHSAWYSWTAPGRGELHLQAEAISSNTNRLTRCVHFSGVPSRENWNLVSMIQDFNSKIYSTWTLVRPGSDFNLAVDTMNYGDYTSFAGSMDVRLSLSFIPAPANDEPDNPAILTGEHLAVPSTLRAASPESTNSVRTVWYEWTPERSGLASAVAVPSMVDVSVYTRSDSGSLLLITNSPTNVFSATAGTAYILCARSSATEPGPDFTLRVDLDGPENDNFEARSPLFGVHTNFFIWNFRASTQPGEPVNQMSSVWWTWTAPSSGWATIRAASRVGISIFTGTNVTNLTEVPVERITAWPSSLFSSTSFNCVAGKEYQIVAYGNTNVIDKSSPAELDVTSFRFVSPVNGDSIRAGEIVRLQMAPVDGGIDGELPDQFLFQQVSVNVFPGLSVSTGKPPVFFASFVYNEYTVGGSLQSFYAVATNRQGILKVSAPLKIKILPENDLFQNATPLESLPKDSSLNFKDATLQIGEEELLGLPPDSGFATRWWRWRSTDGGDAAIAVRGWEGVTAAVFEGDAITNLRRITGMTNTVAFSEATLKFAAEPATTYYFVIAAKGGWVDFRSFQNPDAPKPHFSLRPEANGQSVVVVFDALFQNAPHQRFGIEASRDCKNWKLIDNVYSGTKEFQFWFADASFQFFRAALYDF